MPIATGTALALGGSALISGATSWFGANAAEEAGERQAAAAREAAATQARSAERALQYQRENYDRTRGDLQPYMNMGTGALGRINDLYGISGNQNLERAYNDFRNSPDYQVAQREGISALQNSAAMRGGLLGGRFGRSVQEFGADLGARQFGNYRGFLTGLAGSGQQAATGLGAIGSQGATNAGNILNQSGQYQGNALMGAGQAEASGIIGGANAINSGIGNSLLMYDRLSRPGGATPVGGGGGWSNDAFRGLTGAGYGGGGIGSR